MEWYKCPLCGKKLLQLGPHANSCEVYIKCDKCHQVIEVVANKK